MLKNNNQLNKYLILFDKYNNGFNNCTLKIDNDIISLIITNKTPSLTKKQKNELLDSKQKNVAENG